MPCTLVQVWETMSNNKSREEIRQLDGCINKMHDRLRILIDARVALEREHLRLQQGVKALQERRAMLSKRLNLKPAHSSTAAAAASIPTPAHAAHVIQDDTPSSELTTDAILPSVIVARPVCHNQSQASSGPIQPNDLPLKTTFIPDTLIDGKFASSDDSVELQLLSWNTFGDKS